MSAQGQPRLSLRDESHNDLAASSQALRDAHTSAEASRAAPPVSAAADALAKWDKRRFSRMINICGDAHLAAETAIKSYTAAVGGQHARRGGGAHSIRDLLKPLLAQQQSDLVAAMGQRTPEDLSPWRIAGSYIREQISLQEIQRITPSFAASMLEAARGVCDLVCGAVEQHYGSHATVEDMREALEDVDRCGSVAALDSQPHFAQGTYARYSVVAPPQALLASATSSPSAGSTLTSPEPGAGLGICQAMTQAGLAGQRTPPATLVCGRKVKSTSKRCILAEGHRGHCRSIKPRAAR